MRRPTLLTALLACGLALACLTSAFSAGRQESRGPGAAEAATINLISHRFPALEFYAEELGKSGLPGVRVESQLVPYDKAADLTRIALSAGGVPPYQIVYADLALLAEYASKGWLEPLDDYIAKYNDVYHFDDIPKASWDAVSYNGKIDAIPIVQNVMHFFWRKDLFTN